MNAHDFLILAVKDGLQDGSITTADLQSIINEHSSNTDADAAISQPMPTVESPIQETHSIISEASKLGIVDILYYLAGGVLYAALMTIATQSTSDGSAARSVIMLMSGVVLWTIAFLLGREQTGEARSGFINAILLTGSLALISGGVFATTNIAGDRGGTLEFVLAVVFLMLGGLHLYFDRLFRHNLLVVFGMFLLIAAFPSFLAGLLSGHDLPIDVWALVGMGTGAVTAIGGTVVARTAAGREHMRDSFFSIAGFIVLSSVYAACVGSEAALLWNIILPVLIYLAFYLSIKRRSRNFLVTGSLFLVLFVITIAFKYFSGFGAAFSLLFSATALLATAFMASSINNRYIKSAEGPSVTHESHT